MEQITKMSSSNKTDEHYTPEWILEYARKVICHEYGQRKFDLDPFSDNNNTAKAKRFFTKEDNGITTDWGLQEGSVWINPPFSKNKEISLLVDKYAKKNPKLRIMMLQKADFRTQWSKILLGSATNMIIVNDYVQFIGAKDNAFFSVVLYVWNVPHFAVRYTKDPKFVPMTFLD